MDKKELVLLSIDQFKEPKSALYGTPALVEPAYNALFRRSNA
jgi:hypothetical protein